MWHQGITEATIADAVLDRLLHNLHRIELTGESMRRNDAPQPPSPNPKPGHVEAGHVEAGHVEAGHASPFTEEST